MATRGTRYTPLTRVSFPEINFRILPISSLPFYVFFFFLSALMHGFLTYVLFPWTHFSIFQSSSPLLIFFFLLLFLLTLIHGFVIYISFTRTCILPPFTLLFPSFFFVFLFLLTMTYSFVADVPSCTPRFFFIAVQVSSYNTFLATAFLFPYA